MQNSNIQDLFGGKIKLKHSPKNYKEFVDKFKPKLTTDDCYTPEIVYDTVLEHIKTQINIDNLNTVRPFYPNMDYKSIEYKENDIVIDNPPFSIMAEILEFYTRLNIKFYLFAPHLTLFSNKKDCTMIVVGANIIYANGASVNTSFCSNLYGDLKIFGDAELYKKLDAIKAKANLPKYKYPEEIVTVNRISKIVAQGIDVKINKNQCQPADKLDAHGKNKFFGSAYFVSKNKASEIKASEIKASEIKASGNYIEFNISEREKKIIEKLF